MADLSELLALGIADARDGLRARRFTARELTSAYLAAMDEARALNLYITETPERALADADLADARLQAGHAEAMTGMPIALKDLFCTEGVRTTAASRILGDFMPPYESTVSGKLRAAGADDILVICGGVIPQQDYDFLYDAGVKAIFGPGTNIPDAARDILAMIRAARG